jgi:hypothetical protein
VSLGSVLSAALPGLRGEAESRFTETFSVFFTERVLDELTGLYTDSEVVVHSVAGRVRFPGLTVSERAQGGLVPAVQDVTVSVAVGSTPDVVVGFLWRVTGSLVDVSLVGRVFRTKGLPQSGKVTAWRYPVESVV